MPAKQYTKTANICTTVYENHFDINFDCVGVKICQFVLCSEMPPTGGEDCTFMENGSCQRTSAQIAAIQFLRKKLAAELKRLEEDF